MLAYAANRPAIATRRPAPNAMLAIIGFHVAAIAVLMSAKMEIQQPVPDPPLKIDFIKPKVQPPTDPVRSDAHTQRPQTTIERETQIPPTHLSQDPLDPVETTPLGPSSFGERVAVVIPEFHPPVHNPVSLGPRLATPDSELKPPYPSSKLLTEEEAVLRLKLTIDQSGRVIAVDPVGRVDAVFLAAARRHLLAHWRYKPASEDGRPVTSSTVITLRFELDA